MKKDDIPDKWDFYYVIFIIICGGGIGAVLGIISGFVACWKTASRGSFNDALVTWISYTVFGAIAGMIIACLVSIIHNVDAEKKHAEELEAKRKMKEEQQKEKAEKDIEHEQELDVLIEKLSDKEFIKGLVQRFAEKTVKEIDKMDKSAWVKNVSLTVTCVVRGNLIEMGKVVDGWDSYDLHGYDRVNLEELRIETLNNLQKEAVEKLVIKELVEVLPEKLNGLINIKNVKIKRKENIYGLSNPYSKHTGICIIADNNNYVPPTNLFE